mmetsp:Transcript_19410/g.28696  ORF Transcript_19410/g.28696 Transcript_19410/m.28696 type:complete len:224 (+) Transcript_19410:774-1445(+)
MMSPGTKMSAARIKFLTMVFMRFMSFSFDFLCASSGWSCGGLCSSSLNFPMNFSCACFSLSSIAFSNIPNRASMSTPSTTPPMIMIPRVTKNIPKILCPLVTGNRSPYPTVVKVATVKYTASIASQSSIHAANTAVPMMRYNRMIANALMIAFFAVCIIFIGFIREPNAAAAAIWAFFNGMIDFCNDIRHFGFLKLGIQQLSIMFLGSCTCGGYWICNCDRGW